MGDKITSSDVCAALKLRYPSNPHALLFEVANDTGLRQRRFADAVAVGLWPSHGHQIEVVEVKVSRGDFLQEMKQPDKSGPIYEFAHAFWLACPKGMVQPSEIPDSWGLLELHNGTLRVKVKAPKLKPKPPNIGFVAAMLRRHAGLDDNMAEARVQKLVTERYDARRQQLECEMESKRERLIGDAQRVTDAARQIQEQTGLDLARYQAGDHVIEAIRVYRGLNEHSYGGAIKQLRDTAAAMVKAADKLLPTKEANTTTACWEGNANG